ncbi:AbrB/MazE/SpoVT family DNA-binding domain-containing protein [Halobacillus salinarum]|uniref:AbrB/MazE/SpoVT family DNA-binding domain-containing protein n=1 Tax=Halobacillus salinarum TaxID=2932257 RepID=A0ABY4EIQ0_9BACI|nr:AbrB/MazE/SpoVT family DNA-binding domain-containing protein [Halobacillus salinarum]UOQ43382.1 AbrB/MazE/SpoVT family DNA-binding domain-containing protein [Halobacillus salinarum]
MKALGIIRKLDELGRVVIPKEVRDSQGWETKQAMEMFMDGEALVIKPYGKTEEKQEAVKELEILKDQVNEEAKQKIEEIIQFVQK